MLLSFLFRATKLDSMFLYWSMSYWLILKRKLRVVVVLVPKW